MTNFENQSAKVILKEKREKSLKNFHPWIYSGAIDRIDGNFDEGHIISIYSQNDIFLGKGFVNTHSQITIRVLTFSDEIINVDFFRNRIKQSLRFRETIIPETTNAYRLINAEGDLLPGLIVDRYDTSLVIQISSLGISQIKDLIVELLLEISKPETIMEKSEGKSLEMERLNPVSEVLFGKIKNSTQIYENGIKF
jgi:23S rRNA (cytosine1962-C5)-methyltransferase